MIRKVCICTGCLLLIVIPLFSGIRYIDRKKGRSLSSNLIKVRLARGRAVIRLNCSGGFNWLTLNNSSKQLGLVVTNLTAAVSNRRIWLDGQPVVSDALVIRPRKGFLRFRKKGYRGEMLLVIRKGKLTLINRIDLESYLKGVLPHEINHRWPIEALKAQAIAARSYAIVKMRENRKKNYDLDNSAYSQVYRGRDGEKRSTSDAVEQTRGLVLMYKGKTAVGFFHASCGGKTESSGHVWSSFIPYLRSRVSPWCRGTKYYRWGVVLSKAQVRSRLRIRTPLSGARVLSRTPSGRVIRLVLRERSGKKHYYSGKTFRRKIGYNRLRSRLFSVRIRGPYLQILGRGWGHGVGLCQWCASGMAKKGFTALRILAHFYPGTRVSRYRLRTEW